MIKPNENPEKSKYHDDRPWREDDAYCTQIVSSCHDVLLFFEWSW